MFEIIFFIALGLATIACMVGFVYYDFIDPIRTKLALAEHFPMYETERETFIEKNKVLEDKGLKVEKLQRAIDRLTTETKYLTGADLLIVKGAIERLKIEYAEVKADYELTKTEFENYKEVFYSLYPFAYPYDKLEDTTPLPKKEILYKNVKKSLDK